MNFNAKKLISVAAACSILLTVSACNLVVKNNEQQFDYPVTVGNLILDEPPAGIAVLSPNLADVALACGLEGRITAISDTCGQEELDILPSVGTPDAPDVSAIQSLGVNLILADSRFDDDTSEKLERLGISQLIIKPAGDMDSMGKLYNNVAASIAGGYTGKMKAMSVFEDVRSSLEAIRVNSSQDNVVSTAAYIYDFENDECLVAYGNDFADQLFEYASITNVTAADDDGVIGIDTLLRSNPDTIFCDSGVYDKITKNKDLKKLKAVIKGTVYELPSSYLELQGLTCIQIADYMAAKTHSDYTQSSQWPEELNVKKEKYVPPFEPQKDIFYTVGETYEPITYVEERLIGLGYLEGEADSTFTEETAAAVSDFQSVNSLEISGIADYDTLKVLLSDKAVAKSEAGEVTFTAE